MNTSTEQLWTVEDVAEYLQVKVSVVKYWVKTGFIPHLRLGRQVRFRKEEVEGWVQRSKHENEFEFERMLEQIHERWEWI